MCSLLYWNYKEGFWIGDFWFYWGLWKKQRFWWWIVGIWIKFKWFCCILANCTYFPHILRDIGFDLLLYNNNQRSQECGRYGQWILCSLCSAPNTSVVFLSGNGRKVVDDVILRTLLVIIWAFLAKDGLFGSTSPSHLQHYSPHSGYRVLRKPSILFAKSHPSMFDPSFEQSLNQYYLDLVEIQLAQTAQLVAPIYIKQYATFLLSEIKAKQHIKHRTNLFLIRKLK